MEMIDREADGSDSLEVRFIGVNDYLVSLTTFRAS